MEIKSWAAHNGASAKRPSIKVPSKFPCRIPPFPSLSAILRKNLASASFMASDSLLSTLAQQLINGLTLGSIYALISLGYTLVYGILLMINFAHSEIFMAGAFFSLLA